MTQEDKELLLKDLCARLPYGIKVNNEIQGDFNVYGICENLVFVRNEVCHIDFSIENIKPYLFPLSSMTEEDIYQIRDILGEDFEINKDGIVDLIYNRRTSLLYSELDALFSYFDKNHFDYRGLIPKDLAIDATNLNID